jgi:phage-related protein
VLEIVAPHESDTYYAVYTVRFKDLIYVLHVFQKKSKRGVATPKADVDLMFADLGLPNLSRNSSRRI